MIPSTLIPIKCNVLYSKENFMLCMTAIICCDFFPFIFKICSQDFSYDKECKNESIHPAFRFPC